MISIGRAIVLLRLLCTPQVVSSQRLIRGVDRENDGEISEDAIERTLIEYDESSPVSTRNLQNGTIAESLHHQADRTLGLFDVNKESRIIGGSKVRVALV